MLAVDRKVFGTMSDKFFVTNYMFCSLHCISTVRYATRVVADAHPAALVHISRACSNFLSHDGEISVSVRSI